MTLKVLVVVFSLFSILHSPSSFAQVSYTGSELGFPDEIKEELEKRISLDLRDITVLDVLKFLSNKADLNIVATQDITARVTLFLKDVSIGSALDIIIISTGLAIEFKEGILYVMTEEEYVALFGESYRDQRQVKILQLKYADATKVGEIIGGLKSAIGRLIIDAQTGTIVLIDTSDKIKLMEETAAKIDIPSIERILPTETEVFELSYNLATDIEPKVSALLTDNVGRVDVDEKTNRLLVTDFEYALKKIRTLINAFDRPTRQVLIETKILQIRLNNQYQMGVNWRQVFNEGTEREKFTWDFTGNFQINQTPANFGQLTLGNLTKNDITATIQTLHTFGDTKTLATPQLMVEHNEEAEILVGTREAYVTSTVSQADSTTTTSEAITFIDVGIQLRVLPTINREGFISMRITPEVSAVGRTLTTSNGNQIPIVDTTNASTKVTVKDGHTILIGGLMQDDISKAVQKLPLLGDIPLVGAAFRFTNDDIDKTELVIFITPHIVGGDEKMPFTGSASGKSFAPFREFDLNVPERDTTVPLYSRKPVAHKS